MTSVPADPERVMRVITSVDDDTEGAWLRAGSLLSLLPEEAKLWLAVPHRDAITVTVKSL